MKLYYIANNRIPTPRAHGIQIVEMCGAFAAAGATVVLLVPQWEERKEDAFAAYGVPHSFTIIYLPILRAPLWLPGAFALRTFSFARAVRKFLSAEQGPAIVYTRGEIPLFLTNIPAHLSLIWETHIKPVHPRRYRKVAERAALLVAATKHYADEIPRIWSIAKGKVFYAPDGVNLESFNNLPSRESARQQLGLPQDKRIALYAGSDVPWKGLRLLRDASDLMGPEVLTVFVGDIKETQAPSARRLFAGAVGYAQVPLWLAAADVLVLTGDLSSETARYYTSPLKLFEYMAAARPIVATDLPSVRDILTGEDAYLAAPDAASLARGIEDALNNPEEAAARAARAAARAPQYSWDARARRIRDFISSRA